MFDSLRFISVRMSDKDDTPLEVVAATPAGTLREVPLTKHDALSVIRDLAGYLRTLGGTDE